MVGCSLQETFHLGCTAVEVVIYPIILGQDVALLGVTAVQVVSVVIYPVCFNLAACFFKASLPPLKLVVTC